MFLDNIWRTAIAMKRKYGGAWSFVHWTEQASLRKKCKGILVVPTCDDLHVTMTLENGVPR